MITDTQKIDLLGDMILRVRVAQVDADRYNKALDLAKQQLTAFLEMYEIKTEDVELANGETYRVTFVQQQRTTIDEDGIKEALGKKFHSVSREILDQKKLEAAIESGDIPVDLITPYLGVRKSNPFSKLTRVEAEDG
jgi:hypothetical protein